MPTLLRSKAVVAALLLAALAGSGARDAMGAGSALVLNEVLYDPAGEDAGAEFVELWNGSLSPEPLEGVAIEAGDGAQPGSWSAIFTGSAGDTVPPLAAFLVGATRLLGAIQNGPDAIRLTRGGGVLDRVGFGSLDAAEFYEGAPALDVASGESLSRRGDGLDTDRNDSDWEGARPTPGVANHPPYRVVLSGSALRPEVVWPGAECAARASVENRGTRALEAGAWEIAVSIRSPGDEAPPDLVTSWIEVGRIAGPALAAGDSARVRHAFLPDRAGPFECRLVAGPASTAVGVAASLTPDSALVVARGGVGPIAIEEFAYRDEGAGEWVELLATTDIAAWDAFSLGDAGSAPRRLLTRGGSRGARAGERRVAASDPARFSARFAIPESLLLATERGWSALNDGASSATAIAPYADAVRVIGGGGVPSDAVLYEEGWSARGGSVERLSPLLPSASSRSWAESVAAAGGTPGAPNSVAAYRDGPPAPSVLLAVPARVLRRDGAGESGALVLELGPAVADRTVRLAILDLRGRVRRLLAAGERFGGGGAILWDGRDDQGRQVEPGLYVARLEASSTEGAPRRASVAIAVAAPTGAAR
ncbi:MAG: hypothetical protein AABZ94_05125 [Candidatus Eisenbacteria bacterium]